MTTQPSSTATRAEQAEREYVLGTGQDELVRLEIQHRLWSDATVAAWRRAGIGPGSRVLDLGSGPGHATFDLAQLVTPEGLVVAVDQSQGFIDHINRAAASRAVRQIRALVSEAERLAGEVTKLAPFDAVYIRWMLCFVPDPAKVLASVRGVLAPGGRLVIHDYFNWGSMSPAPRMPSIDRFVEASMASWRERGGDPDIVARLPGLLAQAGFRLEHMDMHARLARGGRPQGRPDPMMAWPMTWWRTYAPKLVAMGRLTQAECDRGLADLELVERDERRFFVCPPVYELIAHA